MPKVGKPFYTLAISYSSLASNVTYIQISVAGWKRYRDT